MLFVEFHAVSDHETKIAARAARSLTSDGHDHVSCRGRDQCIGRSIGRYSTKYWWSTDRVLVDARVSIGWYIGRVSTDVSTIQTTT